MANNPASATTTAINTATTATTTAAAIAAAIAAAAATALVGVIRQRRRQRSVGACFFCRCFSLENYALICARSRRSLRAYGPSSAAKRTLNFLRPAPR